MAHLPHAQHLPATAELRLLSGSTWPGGRADPCICMPGRGHVAGVSTELTPQHFCAFKMSKSAESSGLNWQRCSSRETCTHTNTSGILMTLQSWEIPDSSEHGNLLWVNVSAPIIWMQFSCKHSERSQRDYVFCFQLDTYRHCSGLSQCKATKGTVRK